MASFYHFSSLVKGGRLAGFAAQVRPRTDVGHGQEPTGCRQHPALRLEPLRRCGSAIRAGKIDFEGGAVVAPVSENSLAGSRYGQCDFSAGSLYGQIDVSAHQADRW